MSGSFNDRFNMTSDVRLPENPFTDGFTAQEIGFYNLDKTYDAGGVRVEMVDPGGRLDDYLNKNWRIQQGWKVPAMWIDGRVWMSLTPMEIQSAYVPITLAGGVVGTAGLGLGYFPLRAASSPDVEEVHVYELNPKVIRFFMEAFKDRPEMEKIRIHEGDVRKEALYSKKTKGPSFDFFWMDVYRTLLPDEVIDDIRLFEKSGSFDVYRFWGQERVVLDSLLAGENPKLDYLDRAYFSAWKGTPMDPEDDSLGLISNLYEPTTSEEYRRAALVPLGILEG